MKPTMNELEVLIRARYPLIYVVSWEELRVLAQVSKIASKLNKNVFEWSVNTGLVPAGTNIQSQKQRDTATQDPLIALGNVIEHVEPALYVFKDFHPFLKSQNMSVIRRLREVASSLKNTYKTIVIVSPMLEIPPELEKDITIVDFDLPRENDFTALLDRIIEEVKTNPKLNVNVNGRMRESIVHALLGLTLAEAENVLAKTLVQHRGFGKESLEVINAEKKQIIRKSGLLEYYDTEETMSSVGGLDALKNWLVKRSLVFSDQAREYGLPAPKGVLLLGVQGCGKSLMAKTISNIWQLPLLRFDVGRLFGSLVGSSEQNVRRAIQVAESVAPVVFWIDEIDKAFRGSRGSGASTDAGTSSRVFSTFLTWLSEKKSPVFVIATANDISALPPELLRKGRFDEIFFVDLPLSREREEIFRVHLAKRKMDPATFDLGALARASEGYSGAEIEEAIISAMFDAFYDKQKLNTERLLTSLRQTVPLSRTMKEDVDELRKWAASRARLATSPETGEEGVGQRKLEI
ncbi:MAG TPA: AAA family ATPase [Sedimentisphaerales bacterium]|nr:AAA family ATPase [Sedimentisphaerales bacterium]HRS12828.1 AAA family ATPase [Sedimentisphaerales bacterium]HRV49447.1 AAA family ATPase [Sedimentisphaerales bacterium]